MVEGSLLLAASFAVLMIGVELSPPGQMAWMWLLLSTIPLTLGELLLDTMGQAYFCRHAPKRYLSTVLSLWLATSTAGYLGTAWLAEYWGKVSTTAFFGLSAAVAIASALTLSLLAIANKKAHHG
jgi:dipeptide/tripeptide permease